MENVTFETGKYGLKAVATRWLSSLTLTELKSANIAELELNSGKGWHADNIEFLDQFPRLKAVTVTNLDLKSDATINQLHDLRSLNLYTYCKNEITFGAFSNLEDCAIIWRPKATSIFDCTSLKRLYINSYDKHDIAAISRLKDLESLAIVTAPIKSLLGFAELTNLKFLRLAGLRRLSSIKELSALTSLEQLDIDTCRLLDSMDAISSLTRLRKLCFNNCGEIKSLKPIESLSNLEWLTFYESTNIMDGNLTPLLRLQKLALVTFQNRKHYSHQREDFPSLPVTEMLIRLPLP